MEKLTLKSKIEINHKDIFYKKIEGEIIALDVKNKELYEFNETAGFIWSEANEKKATFGRIIDKLSARYNITKEKAERDIRELLANCINKEIFIIS